MDPNVIICPRDPITLSDDDYGVESPPQKGIWISIPFSEGDWIPRDVQFAGSECISSMLYHVFEHLCHLLLVQDTSLKNAKWNCKSAIVK